MFWYPWGKEALDLAREENKPILVSIGYSTCYWCHVMEREVFENPSIAALMNRCFVNIKIDREEHPALDEIYMVARQLMTHEGGWPNNVFLTPDLKPFFAGGTYGPQDNYGKPSFTRLLEWLNYSWTTQEEDVKRVAEQTTEQMQAYLIHQMPETAPEADVTVLATALFQQLKKHHDESSGGFFMAPKFPHECYLNFLSGYYERSGKIEALDMMVRSLGRMAAGGIYDQVGAGFHRYAVDKEWYVPHFEKMLYNQAMLARAYTDAARLTGSDYFADIAKSVLDFTQGPLLDGNGAFYAAIDAETQGVEGEYYVWSSEQLEQVLAPEEAQFLVTFFALADVPAFPGHKHPNGQVIVARKPLDVAAHEQNMPYVQLAALTGKVMNKLLNARNERTPPNLDNKIIVSWNGLMIDAYAYAARVFKELHYSKVARRAADYILEQAIDNNGRLQRIVSTTSEKIEATLEDYAFLIKGLISLHRATPDEKLLASITSLMQQADEQFLDPAGGYFLTSAATQALIRVKNGEDSTLPNANAVMAENLVALYEITKDKKYRERAQTLTQFFLRDPQQSLVESATMLLAALSLVQETIGVGHAAFESREQGDETPPAPDEVVKVSAKLNPANAKPGDECDVEVTLDIKKGWSINAATPQPLLIATQLEVQGPAVEQLAVNYPKPVEKTENDETHLVYEGAVTCTVRVRLLPVADKRPPLKVRLRVQPCQGGACYAIRDIVLSI